MSDLVKHQEALEQLMLDEAVARQANENAKATKRGEFGDTKAGRFYVRGLSRKLTPAIDNFINTKRTVGRHHIAARMLKDAGLEPEVIAYLTVKATLNLFSIKKDMALKRVNLCRAIAELLHDEWRVRYFADDKRRKALLKKLLKDFDKRTYPRAWRKRTIKNYFDAEQLDWEGWNLRQKVHIGYALACILRDETGMIEAVDGDTRYKLADEFWAHAQDLLTHQAPSFILYRPMVVPPKPWTDDTLFRGGYLSNKIKRYPIIKHAGKRDVERMSNMDWSRILPAINALQETPWRVNARMLEAVQYAYNVLTKRDEFKNGIGSLVACDERKLPPEPEGYRVDEEVTKEHNRKCFLIHDQNRQDKSKRIAALMAMGMAKQFVEYEAIYFPHNLDSRGRAYPVPAILNPQGPDYVKAMLEFAVGEPIETDEQANWLAIAGANAYGNDKISLEERAKWVRDNEELILGVANDYEHDLRWTHASEPFQFLRFCFEWAEFRREGYGFKSHMVVPVDATCSGLQHFSAMLRDERGGRSVNLIPGLERQDVYGDVAKVVIQELVADGSPMAQDWLTFGIDRKMTKRQVMVVPYAGKFASCLDYTKEAFEEKLKEGHPCPWDLNDDEATRERITYLARLIWNAIDQVVVKAKEAMRWLTKVASDFAKWANKQKVDHPYQRRMTWLTPDGFEVCHYREDQKRTRLDTFFDGRAQLVLFMDNGKLNVKDMGLAVAPNFVHALDANHLRATIIKAKTMNIQHFGMVHDSFGVHANKMPQFISDCVKPTFVEMYSSHDVLQELHDRYGKAIKLDPPPAKGRLDLDGILKSEFFFS